MPWAGYENRCRAEKLRATAGGVDGGPYPGLYAAGGGYAGSGFDASRPDVGHAARAAAIFNADPGSIPDAGSTNANVNDTAGGGQQCGQCYGPFYPAD